MYDVHPDNLVFREVLNQTPHPMFVVDGACRVLAANPAALAVYGYESDRLVGMSIVAITDASEHGRLKACFADFSPAVRSTGRWKHLRADGSGLTVEITSYGLVYDGTAARVVLAVDVTQQVGAEERLRQYVGKLEAALAASIDAFSAMMELRDQYTATHQKRVSRLAVALAAEMRLGAATREGIAVMGLVHDIGKVGIPFGILSKPGSLTAAEYEVVKAHPQFGYDILARMDFGWPVAETVLQHHERLDGSGYPNGLKGGDIRLESRVIAVADVIESICSHRPYRPGRGEHQALEEVTSRAPLYGEDVVEAAVRLFGRGYTIQ